MVYSILVYLCFFFKQKTAYEMRISDWSSDVCSSDLKGTNAAAVVVDTRAELDGLSDAEISAATEAAKTRGLAGKYVITLQNTTGQPPLANLKNRALREKIFKASVMRCNLDRKSTRLNSSH